MRIKKLLTVIIATALSMFFCFAICACAPGNNGGDPPIDDPGGSEEPEEKIYSANTDPELAEIRIATNDGRDVTGDIDHKEYVDCTVTVTGCAEEYKIAGAAAQVKVRGNYTANYEKKPFRIKYEKKQKMLGLNDDTKAKSWVLLAEYKDSSMSRNATAFYLGKTLLGSDGYYCSDFRYVKLYLNDKYRGMYLLAEQQQVNETRVNIAEPEKDYKGTDIGYFFEMDGYYDKESPEETFTTNYDGRWLKRKNGSMTNGFQAGYTLKNDIYDRAQRDFIADRMAKIFRIAYNALNGKGYMEFDSDGKLRNSGFQSAQETIENVIDVDSLVDMYILQEICCDMDINWSSFFLSLDMSANGNKKLTFEAPWDFDSAIGLSYTENRYLYAADSNNPWLILLVNEDWFWDKVADKWEWMKEKDITGESLRLIETYSDIYKGDYADNFGRWPNSMGVRHEEQMSPITETFKTQADASAYLHDWLKTRYQYLNKYFVKTSA